MKGTNALLAGFLNMLIPGSSNLYVRGDWRKFILSFIGYGFMIFVTILIGNNIQYLREYTLPQGLCTGGLLLAVFAFLFHTGMKEASIRNSEIDSAAHYQSMRSDTSGDDPVAKLAKLQRQRDQGLISDEQQETKKAEIESKRK
ncbi:MAG: SHOCT domain-containing protein [Anaerolineaceae bacterium]|jgi:hypothetical protein|nr:MAG: SHOCT domain-containing protein [Anaerolineaceae bacterium]